MKKGWRGRKGGTGNDKLSHTGGEGSPQIKFVVYSLWDIFVPWLQAGLLLLSLFSFLGCGWVG